MEEVRNRFSHIMEQINALLDNKSLVKCKEADREMCKFIKNQRSGRFLTTRKIQRYNKNSDEFEKDWKIVCQKLPIDKLNQFAILVKQFHDAYPMRFKQKWSPMHVMAERGHLDLCKFIATVTEERNPQCQNKWTPIHFAAQAGHFHVLNFLCEEIVDKNCKTDVGLSALHLAAKNGHLEIFQLLCENLGDINPNMDKEITPLHLAAQNGHLDVCKYICENAVHIRPIRNDGFIPLQLAAHRGQMKVSKLLIENDLDNLRADILRLFWFIKMSLFIFGLVLFCLVHISNGLEWIYDYWYENINTNYPEKEQWRNLGVIYEDLHPLTIFLCNRCAPFIILVQSHILTALFTPFMFFCFDIWFCYKKSPILNY